MEQFKAFLEQFHTTGVSDAYRFLGCHAQNRDGVDGFVFRTWAPQAQSVRVTGDFNFWNEEDLPMQPVGCGVWEAFSRFAQPGQRYKLCIKTKDGRTVYKTDPYGNRCGVLPDTASIIEAEDGFVWHDGLYRARRRKEKILNRPVNIYEVHAGSWKRHEDGSVLSFRELAQQLVPYVRDMGYTHIELLPVMEYPYDPSWGYQITCYYAPTHRYGAPEDLKYFIDEAHRAGIGVILDWVPGHFPTDDFALAEFDGTNLYEHSDPREGYHQDWNTLIYNYGRREVSNFLVGNALYWIERFGIDALRVDAVASMIYRDYSRKVGEWIPNEFGGRENLEAIEFLRNTNRILGEQVSGAVTMAEESTDFPGVSRPQDMGGLGFWYKWNLGWMHDTLDYMKLDPVYRQYHHDKLTFGMLYNYTENFVLPLSHDEVVHGKKSILDRMPGDAWQKFANLRAYYGWMWAFPGKKLLFMGNEFAQGREWNHDTSLDWHLLEGGDNWHHGVQRLVRDLNLTYRHHKAMHELDFDPYGFEWLVVDDKERSVLIFVRRDKEGNEIIVASNFTPVPRHDYRFGINQPGKWREILNTDSMHYHGSNAGNGGTVHSDEIASHGRQHSLSLTLPPLATIWLVREAE